MLFNKDYTTNIIKLKYDHFEMFYEHAFETNFKNIHKDIFY